MDLMVNALNTIIIRLVSVPLEEVEFLKYLGLSSTVTGKSKNEINKELGLACSLSAYAKTILWFKRDFNQNQMPHLCNISLSFLSSS